MRTYLTTTSFADGRRKARTRTVRAATRSDARAQARSHAKALWPNAKVAKVTAEHVSGSSTPAMAPISKPVQATVPAPIATAADESRKAAARAAFQAIVTLQGGKAAARAYRSVMQADDAFATASNAIFEAELASLANN